MSKERTEERLKWLDMVNADASLSASAFRVGFVISAHINEASGIAWPSLATIANAVHLHERGLRNLIAALRDRGFLDVKQPGRGGSNRYVLTFPGEIFQRSDLSQKVTRFGGQDRHQTAGLDRHQTAGLERHQTAGLERHRTAGQLGKSAVLVLDRHKTAGLDRHSSAPQTGTGVPPISSNEIIDSIPSRSEAVPARGGALDEGRKVAFDEASRFVSGPAANGVDKAKVAESFKRLAAGMPDAAPRARAPP